MCMCILSARDDCLYIVNLLIPVVRWLLLCLALHTRALMVFCQDPWTPVRQLGSPCAVLVGTLSLFTVYPIP